MTLPGHHAAASSEPAASVTYPGLTSSHPHHVVNHVSAEKTRDALLRLEEAPADNLAITTLWLENREIIEREINHYFPSSTDPGLLRRILSRLAAHARFFGEEIDQPSAWVARCANLEVRRAALQLKK